MRSGGARWLVHDKRLFLLAIMEELAGNAHISFEGNLRNLRLGSIPGASEAETVALKRGTLWPKQDFIVLPLEPFMSKAILSAIGGTVPGTIIHVQIEKENVLEFGAYDNFHPECIYFRGGVRQEFLESMVSQGLLKSVQEPPGSRTAAEK
jgi:hypothetical protein